MMNGLRRGVTALAPQMRSGLKHNGRLAVVSRHMVDLATKEQGEEVSYIRRQEHERKARLRAQMEEILAREQHDEEQQALINVIESKKEQVNSKDVGILQYLGLDDWKWALPVSISLASPMIAHEVIVVDYKFYLVGAFCMMWHAYDMVVLPIYLEKTSWIGEYIANFWKDVDDKAVAEINDAIDSSEGFIDAKDVFKDMFTGIDEVAAAQATALNLTNQNDLHRAIQKKLDALASLNEATNAAIRTDMMQTIKSEAFQVVSSDRKVKDAALSQAIATLAAGPNGKRGKDVVGEVYAKAIADYRAGLSAKDHKVHNITAKLEADIAEIVKAPAVIKTAGNVYETHPILVITLRYNETFLYRYISFRYQPQHPWFTDGLNETNLALVRHPLHVFSSFDWVLWNLPNVSKTACSNPQTVLVFSPLLLRRDDSLRVLHALPELKRNEKRAVVFAGEDVRLLKVMPFISVFLRRNQFSHYWYEAKDVRSDKIRTIPMGFTSYYLLRSGLNNIERAVSLSDIRSNRSLVAAAWGKVSKIDSFYPRRLFSAYMRTVKWVNRSMWSHEEYWFQLSQFKFFLAPAGLGVQAPKFAECWMVGTVPVTIRMPAFEDLRDMGFPIVIIDKWTDLSVKFLNAWYYSNYSKIDWKHVRDMLTHDSVMHMLLD